VAALADLVDVRDADPASHEDMLELPVEHAGIGERRLRQRRRALEGLARALELANRQGQRRIAYRHPRSLLGFVLRPVLVRAARRQRITLPGHVPSRTILPARVASGVGPRATAPRTATGTSTWAGSHGARRGAAPRRCRAAVR